MLDNTGDKGLRLPAQIWDISLPARRPPTHWSAEQAEFLAAVEQGVGAADANVDAAGVRAGEASCVNSRLLFVTGKPGAGKTEAVCGAAMAAASKCERVLIACPLGAQVDIYRQKLGINENIVIETVHASHKITRNADELYIPPGRLRTFDLIIYEEVSQLDAEVWKKVRTAIAELNPHPFVCLVGDFHKLQAINGAGRLRSWIERQVD